MAIIKIQHSFQGYTGIPADRYMNTFMAVTEGPPSPALGALLKDDIAGFYGDLEQYIANTAKAPGRTIRMYDIAEAIPRVPFFEYTQPNAISNVNTTAMPSEVAACLSFEGTQVSGLSQARRRGRIYLGPLTTAAATTATTSPFQCRPAQAFIDAVIAAALALRAGMELSGAIWSVYSPLTNPPSTAECVRWWMDNAFDTQRRRGCDPTLTTNSNYTPGP